jgi:hypothetical protein
MINFLRIPAKSAVSLLIAVCLITSAIACFPAMPSIPPPPENPPPPSSLSSQPPEALTDKQPVTGSGGTVISISENTSQPRSGPAVEIMLIHHRGTLKWIGDCARTPVLYEKDEYVVIQNLGDTAQDITNWSLANITRGYPTFRFPPLFPCLPYNIPAEEENIVPGSTFTVTQNPAQSEINRLSPATNTEKPTNQPVGEMDWASCSPVEPIDQTPMKPAKGQQGIPVPCTLYPGQIILVFTDEIHCASGGFSFNWGQGNIWSNEIPDTAVLYDSNGKEVSRRSYTVGR